MGKGRKKTIIKMTRKARQAKKKASIKRKIEASK